jgi:excinuclease UvrABC nuclease subunit
LGYDFAVYDSNATWNDVGGVYIFAGLNAQHRWVPLYAGKADSFRTRIPQHERWSEAVRLGATHVHAMVVPAEATRAAIEAELIRQLQPPLNQQLR